MVDLQELVVVVPPSEPGALDTDSLDDATAAALEVPDPALESQPAPGETLWMALPVAGTPVRLEVHPLALEGLVVDRYCAGGWRAVSELREAVTQALRAADPFEGRSEGEVERSVAHAVAFARRLAAAVELLEQLVKEALVRIAADALAAARARMAKLSPVLQAQRERYGLAPVEGAGGGEGRSGSDALYADNPTVVVLGDPAPAKALARAVQELVAAHRAIYLTRAAERGSQPGGLEAAGGAPGQDTASKVDPIDAAAEARIAEVERAFVELSGRVTRGPEGHLLAPAVFALVRGEQVYVRGEVSEQAIWSKAYVYLRDVPRLLDAALPKEDGGYPFAALRERLAIPLAALQLERPAGALDSPELRASLWASERQRGYAYEPLDDEALLVALHREYADRMLARPPPRAEASQEDSSGELEGAFRYRVLTELLRVRDTRDRIRALQAAAGQKAQETLDRVAGVLGLLGLAFPPAEAASALLGLYAAAGSALTAMREIDAANRAIDAQAAGALLAGDSARYALLISSRPSVAGVLLEMLGDLAAFHAIGQVSRELGVGLQVFFDLQAIAPSLEEVLGTGSEG
ncbi:hypothetical protein FGE12_26825 [Aggregicoccus sp. 17bor-14]|uniref:hypothetical protein n=1 Tax=Myxococcaceae TaxID=31 RepID=UPI00129CE8DD|nr:MULTISPECIES: hypothetical protein [Myxococcaceae]MBF5046057.1 hypothetical protein [Simulacricoccus sp. 17bor-14]MRI91787.1 hypothetical protein [Aggregicoccus sp. 17bor-14]